MTKLTKNLLLSTLLAVVASGPAFADDKATKNDHESTDCTAAGASAQAGKTGDSHADKMAGNEKAKADGRRYAASSPFQWQPGNPFRDDTAA